MGLKEDLCNLCLTHIELESQVVVFNGLYWSVNILIIDEVLLEKELHLFVLKVLSCFGLIHACLSILEIFSLTLAYYYI